MKELKTLKDLKKEISNKYEYDEYGSWMEEGRKRLIKDLKQEAIKWVKEMKSDMPEGRTPKEVKDIINGMNGAINWIKKFFNLSEKDLKWKKQ